MKNKIVSAAEAAAVIRAGDTVSVSGFVGIGTPDEMLVAIEKRFLETGEPTDLTLVFVAAPGDSKDRGLNRLVHPGLVKRGIGGHWALVPKLARLAVDGKDIRQTREGDASPGLTVLLIVSRGQPPIRTWMCIEPKTPCLSGFCV